jgi:hypothetical protein
MLTSADTNVNHSTSNALAIRTRAYKVAAVAIPEIVKHAVAVVLHHLGVDVEAGVAQLCDLLGQQLHTVHRVAEDDGLVDLQLQTGGTLVSRHQCMQSSIISTSTAHHHS